MKKKFADLPSLLLCCTIIFLKVSEPPGLWYRYHSRSTFPLVGWWSRLWINNTVCVTSIRSNNSARVHTHTHVSDIVWQMCYNIKNMSTFKLFKLHIYFERLQKAEILNQKFDCSVFTAELRHFFFEQYCKYFRTEETNCCSFVIQMFPIRASNRIAQQARSYFVTACDKTPVGDGLDYRHLLQSY